MKFEDVLPVDYANSSLIGRVFDPEVGGPCVVVVNGDELWDITPEALTVSQLLEQDNHLDIIRNAKPAKKWSLQEVVNNSLQEDYSKPFLLSPNDLQVIKACGVTFIGSMLERVIEERASGDPLKAQDIRRKITAVIGDKLSNIQPGSEKASHVKNVLIEEGVWSQYLEVGIGPDAEVFTKSPVLSAVGFGQKIGILSASKWNNPEPELVLVVNSKGQIKGASLGNDVNLRDIEGRSALLLGKAKDNNASCAIGPFIRLFDESFNIDSLRTLEIQLSVEGEDDGFTLQGVNSISQISRDLTDLVQQTLGKHHQYPDGFVLFTGTLFAPTDDRDVKGEGFTHKCGDIVKISAKEIGLLQNQVEKSESLPPWNFGIGALMSNLARRNLLS